MRRQNKEWQRKSFNAQKRVGPKATAALTAAGFAYLVDMGGAAWWCNLERRDEGATDSDLIGVTGDEEDGGDVRDGRPIFLVFYVNTIAARSQRATSLREALQVIKSWQAARPRARAYNHNRDG